MQVKESLRDRATRREGTIDFLAALWSVEVVVSRARHRGHLRAMYPGEISMRWAKNLKRRRYSVPFHNSEWHIDGQHKLSRWILVIHGGMGGNP